MYTSLGPAVEIRAINRSAVIQRGLYHVEQAAQIQVISENVCQSVAGDSARAARDKIGDRYGHLAPVRITEVDDEFAHG
jgi:hypothetical protein